MPYLAFDLDAKKLVPQVAKSAGVQACEVGWGLLELWDFVWSKKTASVDTLVLTGCFGPNDRIVEALVSYGFLESEDGGYRVRGAERYLRVAAARSEGGKKAAGNLKRGNKPAGAEPEKSPGSLPAPSRLEPGTSRGGFPALTASSEQRAASSESTTPQGPPHGSPPLTDQLAAIFRAERGQDYGLSAADEHAGRELLRLAAKAPDPEGEICRRWTNALRRRRYPLVSSLRELAKPEAWNHCATDEPPILKATGTDGRPKDIRRGRVAAEDVDWTGQESGVSNEFK